MSSTANIKQFQRNIYKEKIEKIQHGSEMGYLQGPETVRAQGGGNWDLGHGSKHRQGVLRIRLLLSTLETNG